MKDPIVEEVRAAREKLAAEFGFDLHRIAEASRVWQRESGMKAVSLPPRTPEVLVNPVGPGADSPAPDVQHSTPTGG